MKILKKIYFATRESAYSNKKDVLSVFLLFLIPIIVDLTLALAGHPLLQEDNFNQNFPLRVLVGKQIAQGSFPSWDPYIWSGTPLLAAWNAGALYPGEFLFAIFSPIIAWSLNMALASSIAGVGSYFLMRKLKCGPTASFFGAVAFTYTGFFIGQQPHIGLVEGTAFLPWLLLGIENLATATKRLSCVILIAVSSACSVLAGDPRAISTSAIIAVIYTLIWIYRLKTKQKIFNFLLYTGGGALLGAGLSAVQWLPGLSFLHSSSRSVSSYSVYSQGSLSLPRIALHMVLPFIKGTGTNFGTPTYQGIYNLPEVTIGVGFFALAAALSYLPILLRQFLQFVKHKGKNLSPLYAKPLATWYVIGLIGFLLTLGSNTFLGHLFFHIPLFSGERLQNRNAEMFDTSLAILLAFFIDDHFGKQLPRNANEPVTEKSVSKSNRTDRSIPTPLSTWPRRILALIPVACAIALIVFAYVAPLTFEKKISLVVRTPGFFDALDPYLIPALITALLIMLYLLFGYRIKAVMRNFIFILLLIADLGIYSAFTGYQTFNVSQIGANSRISKTIATVTGPYGRAALFNPSFLVPKAYPGADAKLAIPDLNIWQKILSVQGYGSAVNADYENITNTHQLENLQSSELNGRVFNSLNLKTLIASPITFGEDIPPYSAIPVAGGKPATATGLPGSTADAPNPTPYSGGPVTISPFANKIFYLPYIHTVKRITVVVNNPFTDNLKIGVAPGEIIARQVVGNLYTTKNSDDTVSIRTIESRNSSLRSFRKSISQTVFHNEVHISFAPTKANAIKIADDSSEPLIIGAVVIVTSHPSTRFLADGALEGNLNPKQWGFAGIIDGFSVFINSDNNGPAWLQAADSISSKSRNEITKTLTQDGTVKTISTPGAIYPRFAVTSKRRQKLIISQAYAPGWTARILSLATHKTEVEGVKQFGLIDSVEIPKGSFLVKMVYAPTSLLEGIVITFISILFIIIIGLLAAFRRRKLHKLHTTDRSDR